MSEDNSGSRPTWLKAAVISGVVSGVLSLLAPVLEWLLSNVGVSLGWLTRFSGIIVGILTYKVQVWIVLLILVTVEGMAYLWKTIVATTSGHTKVDGVIWRWTAKDGEVDKESLAPYCPRCEDYQLAFDPVFASNSNVIPPPVNGCKTECEECGYSQKWDMKEDEFKDRVKRAIESQFKV